MSQETCAPVRPGLREELLRGLVIPAHPLALDASRKLDERHQAALTRYYCQAGAGGIAVGVHTTQFAIRDPRVGLFEPVLRLVEAEIRAWEEHGSDYLVRIAGICGSTEQALREAALARDIGYHAGLLSLSALRDASDSVLAAHCRRVAAVIPLFGFYLQADVGGRPLGESFWREFLEIDNVLAVKVAPFNRYQTLDVVRALIGGGREHEVALYTGNDDTIVTDLLAEFRLSAGGRTAAVRFAGGLLGQWAVWTKRAVELLEEIQDCRRTGGAGAYGILGRAAELTDANAALFDARNRFRGSIAGLHEVLRRQGLMAGRWCLDPEEDLSPGQMEEIDRVCEAYPHLNDDAFVAENLDRWLS